MTQIDSHELVFHHAECDVEESEALQLCIGVAMCSATRYTSAVYQSFYIWLCSCLAILADMYESPLKA